MSCFLFVYDCSFLCLLFSAYYACYSSLLQVVLCPLLLIVYVLAYICLSLPQSFNVFVSRSLCPKIWCLCLRPSDSISVCMSRVRLCVCACHHLDVFACISVCLWWFRPNCWCALLNAQTVHRYFTSTFINISVLFCLCMHLRWQLGLLDVVVPM